MVVRPDNFQFWYIVPGFAGFQDYPTNHNLLIFLGSTLKTPDSLEDKWYS
jgi:hypothetical protein